MPFQIIQGDITKLKVDAIVNAASPSLLGGGGVDGAIHAAAGEELLRECRSLGGCRPGEAKMTGGYRLPCRYVIHTVGPVYSGGNAGEEKILRSCYAASLALASGSGCGSVAFPLISSGAYGYPPADALRVATEEISSFLAGSDMLVYLVIYDKKKFVLSGGSFDSILPLLEKGPPLEDLRFSGAPSPCGAPVSPRKRVSRKTALAGSLDALSAFSLSNGTEDRLEAACPVSDLGPFVLDESFSEMLLRKIDEEGLTDAQCYRRANVDRKLFSKIRSDKHYRPSKITAVSFAIALKLPPEEADEMLRKAGFALSQSNYFDLIVRACIERGEYDVCRINELLFRYDMPLLGC